MSVLRFFLGSVLLHRLARLMWDLLSLLAEPVLDLCSCSNMALTWAFLAACAGVNSLCSSAANAAARRFVAASSGSSALSAAASPSRAAEAPRLLQGSQQGSDSIQAQDIRGLLQKHTCMY
jgi:hypothetical protein